MGDAGEDSARVVADYFDALGRRDIDAAAECWHDDGEWRPQAAGMVEGGAYRGPDGIRQYVADMRQVMESVTVDVEEVRQIGALTVALGRVQATGLGSGAQIDEDLGVVFEVDSGRIRSGVSFRDREAALAAASGGQDGSTHGS
jgi:ketosteroid isomerase-like protein